jgi:hypothetical protein
VLQQFSHSADAVRLVVQVGAIPAGYLLKTIPETEFNWISIFKLELGSG